MTGIELYSTTAANNNSAVPNGWPEGMAPSGVNDAARQMMAAIRTWYQDAEWVNLGYTHTYVGATQFKISGSDVTAFYPVGRRVRAVGSSTGTIYGTISVSSFATDTTITVVWDSGSLSNESLTVSVGIIKGASTGRSIAAASIGAAASGANTDITSVYLNNTGLKIKDTNASHGLIIAPGSNITADRTLGLITGDADRNLTITSDTSIGRGQYLGTSTNDSATAANIGEYVESNIVGGSAVSLTTATGANITSISLTAGDWDVSIQGYFSLGATTTITALTVSLSAVSATPSFASPNLGAIAGSSIVLGNTTTPSITVAPVRVSLSGTTPYYFVAYAAFAVSTCAAFGIIRARRVR